VHSYGHSAEPNTESDEHENVVCLTLKVRMLQEVAYWSSVGPPTCLQMSHGSG
jgi:hypothetical protein